MNLLYQKRKIIRNIILVIPHLVVDMPPVQCLNRISCRIRMEMYLNQEATVASQDLPVLKNSSPMDVKLKGTIFLIGRELFLMIKQLSRTVPLK